jgi:hypothetical protein
VKYRQAFEEAAGGLLYPILPYKILPDANLGIKQAGVGTE